MSYITSIEMLLKIPTSIPISCRRDVAMQSRIARTNSSWEHWTSNCFLLCFLQDIIQKHVASLSCTLPLHPSLFSLLCLLNFFTADSLAFRLGLIVVWQSCCCWRCCFEDFLIEWMDYGGVVAAQSAADAHAPLLGSAHVEQIYAVFAAVGSWVNCKGSTCQRNPVIAPLIQISRFRKGR